MGDVPPNAKEINSFTSRKLNVTGLFEALQFKFNVLGIILLA